MRPPPRSTIVVFGLGALVLHTNLATVAAGPSLVTPASRLTVVSGAREAPTCQSITANYITHGLPQQCLKTARTWGGALPQKGTENATAEAPGALISGGTDNTMLEEQMTVSPTATTTAASEASPIPPPSSSQNLSTSSKTSPESAPSGAPKEAEPDADSENDSPLDSSNFLSFEEWKVQNLARAGQSSESFAHRVREPRKSPGSINNALDSLGEDSEIELDFGFDSGSEGDTQYGAGRAVKSSNTPSPAESAIPRGHARSADAGKTCKERFNYASFDCAATVHKTNPEVKGTTAILVENKDSYMLNVCGAKEKFFIVELCEDILVDTVVLSNFEFFSSMFRTFRVSVSDRYPVKQTGWKELGVFEARNSREVQAFLIENALIWARYLKVEFLTHYGNEFYCPVSLLRVHGTTMMEEFKHQEELARGEIEDDVREEVVPEAVAENIDEVKTTDIPEASSEAPSKASAQPTETVQDGEDSDDAVKQQHYRSVPDIGSLPTLVCKDQSANNLFLFEKPSLPICEAVYTPSPTQPMIPASSGPSIIISAGVKLSTTSLDVVISQIPSSTSGSREFSSASQSSKITSYKETSFASTKTSGSSLQEARTPPPPPPKNPTTQESFFNTVHKRLTLLEANASLSLQYIEDQSRALRDALAKMEKRQTLKTSQFIEQLNSTVLDQLGKYGQQFDQLWQSTVIALESQRTQSEMEMVAISSRLTLLADELIFQKRMYQVQSILLLITIGVVIFSRNSHLDIPLVQHLRARSSMRLFESPPCSPPPQSFRTPRPENYRSASSDSVTSPIADFSPRTPQSDFHSSRECSPVPDETRSGPSTPSGTRGVSASSRGWMHFGPKLKVESKGKLWQRLPSPLGSASDELDGCDGNPEIETMSVGSDEDERGRPTSGEAMYGNFNDLTARVGGGDATPSKKVMDG